MLARYCRTISGQFFINSFRNVCAHNERLYEHRHIRGIKIKSTILHNLHNLEFKYSLFDLILILVSFMTNFEYFLLFKDLIVSPLALLYSNIGEKRFIKILNMMNFPKNWQEILTIEDSFNKYIDLYEKEKI